MNNIAAQFTAHCRPRSYGRQRAAKPTHRNNSLMDKLNELKKENWTEQRLKCQ